MVYPKEYEKSDDMTDVYIIDMSGDAWNLISQLSEVMTDSD